MFKKLLISVIVVGALAFLFREFNQMVLGKAAKDVFSSTHPCGAEIHSSCGSIKIKRDNIDNLSELLRCLTDNFGSLEEEETLASAQCQEFRQKKASQWAEIGQACRRERSTFCIDETGGLNCLTNNKNALSAECNSSIAGFGGIQ